MTKLINFYRKLYENNLVWIQAIGAWFLISILIGSLIYFVRPSLLTDLLNEFRDQFGPNPGLDYNLVIQIFLKNLLASSIALFGGLVLGLAPLFVVLVNGVLLGFVVTSIISLTQAHPFLSSILLLGGLGPHGIIEIPAFLVSSALGLRLGVEWLSPSVRGRRWQTWKNNFKQNLLVWPSLAFILIIAALIEVYISGRIVDFLK